MNLLEESILISRLFMMLMALSEEARDSLLEREPFVRMVIFDEDRTRENVARLLCDAPVDVLTDLYREVNDVEWTDPFPDVAGTPWEPGWLRLFMSHTNREKVFVAEVAEALEQFAIDAFVAHEDIKPLRTWELEIEESLRSCHGCVAFLSDDFHASYWTDQEVGFCFAREILVISVRMGADPYGFIGRFQAITKGPKAPATVAAEIFTALREDAGYGELVDDALLAKFVASDGFIKAKDTWKLVKTQVQEWTPARRALLEIAPVRNHQIAGAHYGDLPRVIGAFLSNLP